MAKRHSLYMWFLCVSLLFTQSALGSADAAAQLQVAGTYEKSKDYAQAEAVYKQIVTGYPGTDYAFQAQERLAILYVDWYKQVEAEAALQQLIGDFSQHRRIAGALTHIADAYRRLEKHERACELYRYVVDNWPKDEHGLWSQMDLVISYTCLRDHSAADTAFKELCRQYSGHELMPKAVCLIADNYRKLKRHKKACELYEYVVDTWPDAEHVLWSRMGLAMSNVQVGNEDAAEDAIDKLLTGFANDERLATAVCLLADAYRTLGKHREALELYQYDVENFPDDVHAMMSQAGIAKYHIRQGNDASADAAFDKLLTMFSKQPTLPEQIHYVARKYEDSKKHDKALELYQYNVEHFRNNIYTMWSQVRIVRTHILNGNGAAADAAFNKLLTLFSDQPTLHREVYKIGNKFSEAGNNQKAEQVYQYIIDRWSFDVDINSRKSVVMSYISLGLDDEAQSAIENLREDFKDHPDLSLMLWQAAEAYYNEAFRCENQGLDAKAKEYFTKVISTGQGILNQWPDSVAGPEICHISGICFERLDEYGKSIKYYQKVVDEWPDYEHAWEDQFRIAKMSKWLILTGANSDFEAGAAVKTTFKQLVERYPDCSAAEGARNWLEGNLKSTEGGEK